MVLKALRRGAAFHNLLDAWRRLIIISTNKMAAGWREKKEKKRGRKREEKRKGKEKRPAMRPAQPICPALPYLS
jgi:hypothetical protein